MFISENIGSTWDEIIDAVAAPFASYNTYVQFDPGYGTSGDPGETMVYAAAGTNIARCNINPEALWKLQDWEVIYSALCLASGIDAHGDTALYVSDAGIIGDPTPREVYIAYGSSIEMLCLGCDPWCGPGDLGGPYSVWDLSYEVYEIDGYFVDGEIVEIISSDIVCDSWQDAGYDDYCITIVYGVIGIRGVVSGAIGEMYIDGWYMSETTYTWLGEICSGVVDIISSHLTVDVYGAVDPSCVPGVVRTLNPMAPIPPVAPVNLVEFEKLSFGLLANTELWHPMGSDDLWLTRSGASNVLWCLDYNNCDYVWVWEDPLANPIILVSPTCGAQLMSPSGVTLEWNALDAATEYEINLYRYCPQCPDEKKAVSVPNSTDTCAIIGDLMPGTKYYWQVRVATGHPYLSKWSELCEFTTALGPIPNLCSPPCGGDDVILNTNFSWDEVAGAAGYELQIVAAGADGTADFTGATTLTTDVNALASIPGLGYSTTYYWRVRAITASVPGAWAVCIFTTMDEPDEPLPPQDLVVELPDVEEVTPTWLWVLIGIGAALTVAVIILIVTTRRVP